MQVRWIGAAAALLVLAGGSACAATVGFSSTLTGSDETPSNATSGTGRLTAQLDTKSKVFTYRVNYSGLTGPVVAAHFHGPAGPGVAAPPVVPVAKTALANPISGKATLTAQQVSDLEAGKWYFNIHTAANPGGEIRGQVIPAR